MQQFSQNGLVLGIERHVLVTAEITYRLPDHRSLLQTFLWQQFDLHPGLPGLERFLGFWEQEIEGPLHSVRVMRKRLVTAHEVRMISGANIIH